MIETISPDLVRLLLDNSPAGVAVFDAEMRYVAANDRHLIAYGLAGEADVAGLRHDHLVPSGAEQWRDCLNQCVSGVSDCCAGETRAPHADPDRNGGDGRSSAQRLLCWEMRPWRDGTGRRVGVVVFTQVFNAAEGEDVGCASERLRQAEKEVRQAQQELASARAELLEASRVKSSFLATMSHELRTPLASILLFCEMLYEDALAEGNQNMADDLARVVGAGQQLRALIDDLLDFAKLEAGRSKLEYSPFDVAELVRRTAAAVRPLAEKTGNSLEVHCDPQEVGVMVADPSKVRQSLTNLLSNACKFTENGRITLEASRMRNGHNLEWIHFRVLDTGIGISEEVLPRLFRDFMQGDPSLTRKYGGTGLGLAMTRRYVEMMGGTVSAESKPGEGAVFTIRLPVEPV